MEVSIKRELTVKKNRDQMQVSVLQVIISFNFIFPSKACYQSSHNWKQNIYNSK